ncbi:cobyrinate a,c-diamide synthase [Desulfosoma caldarium]|uniref:Cobyrinate a,c-diamide synthase n=1 Tax=Desulfosoma caldarium TaxID=610254 RepID=A0A3N1UHI8_9BACT|nr:cobyrinate a,c-diamide synthase [Desulfosoma caldarium]ROQ89583.1 hydrogenobyrinic acid a,c-diamide synthase (glutamine-hydrolysing) /cobyrinate a,c-diamide synthase [Desulfosoma caldarium]
MSISKWAFVVAAPHSGSGKTTATLAILAALKRRGLTVQPFKVGPDFIDPGLHTCVTGTVSRNLDGWMLSRQVNEALFRHFLHAANCAVVEGVMGLFDGYDGTTEAGSTAEMAKWLHLPVILVVDARSMARSAAALVHGFCSFDPALHCAGVIFNRVGSEAHLQFLREAMASSSNLPVLGGLPRDEVLRLPQRHLGLVTAEENPLSQDFVDHLARWAETHMDLDRLLAVTTLNTQMTVNPKPSNVCAGGVFLGDFGRPFPFTGRRSRDSDPCAQPVQRPTDFENAEKHGHHARTETFSQKGLPDQPLGDASWPLHGSHPRPLIAVARDAAFCFYYQDNLDLLEAFGARLHFFSPLAGETFPEDTAALYLGGGYPEVHAKALQRNERFFEDLRRLAASNRPVYAECGGLMVLSRSIELLSGEKVPMAGILPFGTRMLSRRKALGYVEVVLTRACLLGEPELRMRGHEFHYSEINPQDSLTSCACCYRLRVRKYREEQNEGYQVGSVLASYVHLHWGSAPQAASFFVEAARKALAL